MTARYAKAIYEYEGCTDEEISFPEGAIIRIITKDDNGVDDGWWKGELNGLIGVFPALVVEEITSEDKPSAPMKNVTRSTHDGMVSLFTIFFRHFYSVSAFAEVIYTSIVHKYDIQAWRS